jgi:hypothetical protein
MGRNINTVYENRLAALLIYKQAGWEINTAKILWASLFIFFNAQYNFNVFEGNKLFEYMAVFRYLGTILTYIILHACMN